MKRHLFVFVFKYISKHIASNRSLNVWTTKISQLKQWKKLLTTINFIVFKFCFVNLLFNNNVIFIFIYYVKKNQKVHKIFYKNIRFIFQKKKQWKKNFFNNNIIYRTIKIELIYFVQILNLRKIIQKYFYFTHNFTYFLKNIKFNL